MIGAVYLGQDGVSSDEIVNRYYRKNGVLFEECSYGMTARQVDPSATVTELLRMADVSDEMRDAGGDYPARERTCRATAQAIKDAFNL